MDAMPMVAACATQQALYTLFSQCRWCPERITLNYALCPTCALQAELKYGPCWRARI